MCMAAGPAVTVLMLTPVALCGLALVCGQVAAHKRDVGVSNLQPDAHAALVHANTAAAAVGGTTCHNMHTAQLRGSTLHHDSPAVDASRSCVAVDIHPFCTGT